MFMDTPKKLTFMELTALIKYLNEYITEMEYKRAYEEEHMTDSELCTITRKIEEAKTISKKLQAFWTERITIK